MARQLYTIKTTKYSATFDLHIRLITCYGMSHMYKSSHLLLFLLQEDTYLFCSLLSFLNYHSLLAFLLTKRQFTPTS